MTKLGKLFKTPKNHNSYDIEAMEAEHVFPVSSIIEKKFGFEPTMLPIFGLDSVYMELKRDDAIITVSWDNWSGLYIMGMNEAGDEIVLEIAEYMDNIEEKLVKIMEKEEGSSG